MKRNIIKIEDDDIVSRKNRTANIKSLEETLVKIENSVDKNNVVRSTERINKNRIKIIL